MGEKIIKAKDFMTKYVFSIPPDVTVHELVKLFVTHPVSAVPVVGDDNELLGIVSEGDLLYKKVKPKVPAYLDILGANIYSDIFFVAFKFPNLFRRIFAEGAFTQSFIPSFIKTPRKALFTYTIFIRFFIFLILFSLIVTLFSEFFAC